jgi:hypothetical protein
MSEPSNDDRAEWALEACEAFGESTGLSVKDELETVITDLIANLLHLCDRNGISGDEAIERAQMHYDCEIEAEDYENEEGE